MKIINTATSQPDGIPDQFTRDQVYNGLDCCITLEVLEQILPQLDDHTAPIYSFSRSLQGPALEMRLRGVLVDRSRVAEVIDEFYSKIERLERQLETIVLDGIGLPYFNWRSNRDVQALFYGKLGIPEIKKQGRTTVDRNALQKLGVYTSAKQIVLHIIKMRELEKKINVLKTEVDADGRIRTSYNIAGTNSGRFSSSFSEFGTGGNLQNIEESLRSVFIADYGYKFAKFDAKQIQSRIVGALEWNLFQDSTYLDACESTDLHTYVAKITWPELPWTGDPYKDKEIAEQPFYRHHSYRDMCKKLGHGSNFEGQAETLSEETNVPVPLIQIFQPKYFKAFPAHYRWHAWVAEQIRTKGYIISITGRKRYFFGRRTDPDVIRQAVSYDPQASESFIVNTAMLNIWRKRTAIIMMHEHDGLVYMYPEEREDELVPQLLAQLEVPVDIDHGRTLIVPYEAKIGWNRGKYHAETNPDGLRDYIHGDQNRTRRPKVGIMDRIIRKQHQRA